MIKKIEPEEEFDKQPKIEVEIPEEPINEEVDDDIIEEFNADQELLYEILSGIAKISQ